MNENMINCMAEIMLLCCEKYNLTPAEAVAMFETLKTGLLPQVVN